MLSDNVGSGAGQAILYARVSTARQARGGYSLAQQLEALRGFAARAGYGLLTEVADAAQSGSSLDRPGLDRVRDLVAAGVVAAVLVQDVDRLARDPEHQRLLRREFEAKGCRLGILNDRGVGHDTFAGHESARMAERSLRGKLRKAREGKILAGSSPSYGFRFNAARDGYEVDEGRMGVVRRAFRLVGVEKRSLNAVRRALEAEGVPSPSGNGRWLPSAIRRLVLDDVYRPHTLEEIAELVAPEVGSRLDRGACYGVWWFNRERWTGRQVSEVTAIGRVYRRSVRAVPKPREEWVAVPVPDSGVPREVADAAREALRKNRWNPGGDARFWELSGGILRCGACGRRMRTCVTRRKPDRVYFYYACAKRREGRDACPNRGSYRADALEHAVRRAVAGLLADPGRVRESFEARIRLERPRAWGTPDGKTGVWLDRLAEVDRMRSGYQAMAASGLMTFDELGARLDELEAARRTALQELEAARGRLEEVKGLERDRNALLEAHAGAPPESLESLHPEERHAVYRALRLAVRIGADGALTMSGVSGEVTFGGDGWNPRPRTPIGHGSLRDGSG